MNIGFLYEEIIGNGLFIPDRGYDRVFIFAGDSPILVSWRQRMLARSFQIPMSRS